MPLTLVLADDHQIVRQGLRAILGGETDLQLVGEAARGDEALQLVDRLKPDILVLDLMLPDMNGLEVTRRLTATSSPTRVVILSMHANEAYVVEALRAGASAYVLKESSAFELLQGIHSAVKGERFLSSTISDVAINSYLARAEGASIDPYNTLTPREQEVLRLTADGLSGTEISERLHISPRTVETHRANLMRKLRVRNQKELIRYAMQRLLAPDHKIEKNT